MYATREDLEKELLELDMLLKSEAWKAVDHQMGITEVTTYNKILQAKSPDERAFATGGHHEVRMLRSWPLRRAQYIRETLQRLDERAALEASVKRKDLQF